MHIMQVCVILSSELHFDKGLLGFDSRVSVLIVEFHFDTDVNGIFPSVVSCLLVCRVLAQ